MDPETDATNVVLVLIVCVIGSNDEHVLAETLRLVASCIAVTQAVLQASTTEQYINSALIHVLIRINSRIPLFVQCKINTHPMRLNRTLEKKCLMSIVISHRNSAQIRKEHSLSLDRK